MDTVKVSMPGWKKGLIATVAIVVVVAIALTITYFVRKYASKKGTRKTMTFPNAFATSAPTPAAASSLISLAYALTIHDKSQADIAQYAPPFKTAFLADGRAPAPTNATDIDSFVQTCQGIWGELDGQTVAEAALLAFTTDA